MHLRLIGEKGLFTAECLSPFVAEFLVFTPELRGNSGRKFFQLFVIHIRQARIFVTLRQETNRRRFIHPAQLVNALKTRQQLPLKGVFQEIERPERALCATNEVITGSKQRLKKERQAVNPV